MPALLDTADIWRELLIVPDRDRLAELCIIFYLRQLMFSSEFRFTPYLHQPSQYSLLIRYRRSHSPLNGLVDIRRKRSGQKGFNLHIHAGKPTAKCSIDNEPNLPLPGPQNSPYSTRRPPWNPHPRYTRGNPLIFAHGIPFFCPFASFFPEFPLPLQP